MATTNEFKSFTAWKDFYEKKHSDENKPQKIFEIKDNSGAILAETKINEVIENTTLQKFKSSQKESAELCP